MFRTKMNLLHLFFQIFLFYSVKCSAFLNSISSHVEGQERHLKDDKVVAVNNEDDGLCKRINFNYQENNGFRFDLEGCNPRDEEKYRENDDYKFVNYFGEKFQELEKHNDFEIPKVTGEMKAVYFVGNTGSGKSTLVHILGKDNTMLRSKPANTGSNDYVIIDREGKIGNATVNSKTITPEFVVDRQTNYVLIDNPGFRDTRSTIHEIIATYSIRKSLLSTNKLKIAIVVTHASLVSGNYRSDFTNALKHICETLPNIEKYKNSFYLVATKTENTAKLVNGQLALESDASVINSIGLFLLEVKRSLLYSNTKYSYQDTAELSNFVKIIDALLQKSKDNIFNRLSILRRPMQEGPISDSKSIQDERLQIRKLLLNDENMVEVKRQDIGFPLSEEGILYLNEVFQKFNHYMSVLSKIISKQIAENYETLFDSHKNIEQAIKIQQEIKNKITTLSKHVKNCTTPKEFINVMTSFSYKNDLKLNCFYNHEDINTLNKYLEHLQNFSSSGRYLPSSWALSEEEIIDSIKDRSLRYDFLMHIFELLTVYDVQRNKTETVHDLKKVKPSMKIDAESINTFLEMYQLKNRYRSMTVNDALIKKLNGVINVTLMRDKVVECKDDTLVIYDYVIVLSQINNSAFESCDNAKEIVILAMHTIYIDKDFTDRFIKGKYLTIIAPVWHVIGSRVISVDGLSGGDKLPKANSGKVGVNGKNGKPGGVFVGIGMKFHNGENLLISAQGGKGQDGQDGGDGENGKIGNNGTRKEKKFVYTANRNELIFFYFKVDYYLAAGSNGTRGGDAGAGGAGGSGGSKGSVIVYDVFNENVDIKVDIGNGEKGIDGSDGSPGIGGKHGCLTLYTVVTGYFTVMPFGYNGNETVICREESAENGTIWKSETVENGVDDNSSRYNYKLCEHISSFQKYFETVSRHHVTDGTTEKMMNELKFKKLQNIYRKLN